MRLPRSQELIHWLELGGGALLIRWAAVLLGILVLSVVIAWKQFHGPATETTLVQADVGRQLANGGGFTTLVNYPQTAAVLAARGVAFDPKKPFPELHQAPLYSILIGASLKVLPVPMRSSLFGKAPRPPDGFAADYYLLCLNVVLLWVTALLVYLTARLLFDPAFAWLPALATLVTVTLWQQTVSVNGTALLMVLAAAIFYAWCRADLEERTGPRLAAMAGVGVGCGLLFLSEYSAGALVIVALGYGWVRFTGRDRLWAILIVTGTFILLTLPWAMRNVAWTGNPVALASQNLALKAGDSTAEPATFRATYSETLPSVDLNKLGNKVLSTLQETLRTRLWAGGAMWFAAFFVTSWLYTFRTPAVNRMRWVLASALGVLILSQATFNSGESERWAVIWLAPLLIVFGAGFFTILVKSHASFGQWPRLCAAALLALQALPLAHDALEPRKIHFQYPPYFPALFQSMRAGLEQHRAQESFGLMADVPAGVAWYGGARAWSQPTQLRDFYRVYSEQAIGELLLTPRTLDRPFFSDLNAHAQLPGTLAPVVTPRGEWGEIYAGLLTNVMPSSFPLARSQRIAENLYVLTNPALPNSK